MSTNKIIPAGLRPEFDHLYSDTPSLFELVTKEQFLKSMQMANTDRPIGSIDWLKPVTLESIRTSFRSKRWMDRQVFGDICDAIIRPFGDDMAERTFNTQGGNFVLTFVGEWDSILHEHYERWREHAHGIMRDEVMRIDRHKIVACLMLAVLEAEPLLTMQFSSDEHFLLPKLGLLCNEVLAFQVGMQVLTRFGQEDAFEKGDQDLCERLVAPMCYPLSTVDGESYLDQMYRALYHVRLQLQKQRSATRWDSAGSGQRNDRFSADQFLLLANLVFMLEQYNLYVKTHGQF